MTVSWAGGRSSRPVRFHAVLLSLFVAGSMLGAPSNAAFANSAPNAPTTPGAPTAVSATPGTGSATVRWTAPSNNGGAAVTAYAVTPFLAGVAQPVRTFNSTATTATVTGLTNNVKYTFIVVASNANGTGLWSAAMTPITIGAPKVSTSPTALSTVPGNGQAWVTWAAPADNGSASVTRYLVQPWVGGVAQPVRTYDARTTQIVTGLTNGTRYRFTVVAGNAAGTVHRRR